MRIGRVAVVVAAIAIGAVMAPVSVNAQEEPSPWFVDETLLPFDGLEEQPADQFWGMLGNAGYRAEIPDDWNGDLVMWGHGYRGEGFELTVGNPPIREHLLSRGYAWAASSYEENSYNILTGVESTKALVDLFNSEIAPHEADLVYMTGASMGGHITGVSIEKYHRVYDGAMPICGVMGDFEQFDYFTDYTLASQQLALGESSFPITDLQMWFGETVPAIKDAFGVGPVGFPFVLSEQGEQFKTLIELRSGGVRPNFDEAFAFWHSFPTATGNGNFFFDNSTGSGTLPNSNGKLVLDNSETVYQLDESTALSREERDFNRSIFRIAPDKGARNNGERITGLIRDRVLSLHNLGDLFVPFSHQLDYARDVARQGRSNRLVQRAIRGSGHCDFTQYELTTAFDDLTNWVETGERPAGDPILKRRAVAKDDYGCQFSDPDHTLHTFATPCP